MLLNLLWRERVFSRVSTELDAIDGGKAAMIITNWCTRLPLKGFANFVRALPVLNFGLNINFPKIIAGKNCHNVVKKITFGFNYICNRHTANILKIIVNVPLLFAR